jgi:hypothetical protein
MSFLTGCRGFTGPVPPPLWIRVLQSIQLLNKNSSTQKMKIQAPKEDIFAPNHKYSLLTLLRNTVIITVTL